MKKIAVFILTIFYLTSATGATVNIHYCMGQFAGWDFGHDEAGPCNSCGMEKGSSVDDDCCRDEHKMLKVDDVHKSAQAMVDLMQFVPELTSQQFAYTPVITSSVTEVYPLINAPPGDLALNTYLRIRTIRI